MTKRTAGGGAGCRNLLRGLLAWLVVAPFALWALLRLVPGDVHFRWVQLVAFTPYAALASVAAPVVALLARRRAALVAGVAVTAVLVACVLPRALSDPNGALPGPNGALSGPDRAGSGPAVRAAGGQAARGPVLRLLSANLLKGSVPPAALVDLVRALRPDVLTVQELTPEALEGLRGAGLTRLLPYGDERAREGSGGSGLFTRFPLRPETLTGPGDSRQAQGGVEVPGAEPVGVVSVHPCAPRYVSRFTCWADVLAALPEPGEQVRILSGDFNATLDHSRVRRLLDAGYRDAADATGDGLAGTWPYRQWDFRGLPVPPVTIDHVLVDPRVAVRAFGVHRLPVTDHRAIFAELVLPPARTSATPG
ncbi:endonuclease/exonuclease/phosphatase family protein [Microbispora triticiradicis]|uniref:Endonuclease/exonuclease/phosphatase family protein n=2 Tax=Microbispora TaxID=2005 RepID=A0ABY3LXX4_9ACTN|nr:MULTISPECIES: endonuclease/exonuclease/phosphatase family protein [Microbispora]TLP58613.1 endonuclease/exonuclease/phosphatase family protein [Microbispora fusca]TYB57739.1 endonuclease/exonuclease/phosphatase family protein [Microbispora tritici]